jgi:tRNA(fMet)-specific endonuclease VapC
MIYLLDTSIVSELAKPAPRANIVRSFTTHFDDVRLASVVLHELRYGIERLPAGKRKDTIRAAMEIIVNGIEVLPYETAAAEWHAVERARLQASGRTPPFVDGMVAATAAAHGCALVTANARDFRMFSISVETWS